MARPSSSRPRQRVTQRMIADMAGVSQSTVSLILNGKAGSTARIPESTRDRVLEVIRETTYVANPVARSLAGATNDLIGVFTYEPAFPSATNDFYAPLLTGIESAAEQVGADLLVFTSTPVVNGRRRLFHESNRLRLADGCLLLGREMDPADLEALLDSGYPFVAIGRRDAAGGRVPYIGVDYASATSELAAIAAGLGHRRFGLLHRSLSAESSADRRDGVRRGVPAGGELAEAEVATDDVDRGWEEIRRTRPTVVFVEDARQARALVEICRTEGIEVPRDLSIVELGGDARQGGDDDGFTRLSAPRSELGARAVELLVERIRDGSDAEPVRELLPCAAVPGRTLAPPRT